jgi:leucyl-tRNA synthetase
MKQYNPREIEKKWQKKWQESGIYKVDVNDKTKPKFYVLDMFPYPSGAGLHVGHPKGFIATDIYARFKVLNGFNVLHPMGFDAFGLPAENYAIKNKENPRVCTAKNIETYKKQLEILGLNYDWDRQVDTTDPNFYKWTQWIFLQMFKKGLAFESSEPINWCPSCKTGLANEDLEDGKCERCSSDIEKKPLRQWVLRITDYADRLLKDLDTLPHWESSIKESQRNWIGKSTGSEIYFKIEGSDNNIKVFTTRVDTIFGCTYVVLAPENNLIDELKSQITNWDEVYKYREKVKHKSDLERTDLNKDKTGIILNGIEAINPFNNEKVTVYIADYVLNSYGTGAVMAVPAHDERDFEFAKKYNIEMKVVLGEEDTLEKAFTKESILKNSGEFTGLESQEARKKMIQFLEESNNGLAKVNYKLKDWVFSRQRYWGEPIPIIHCKKCGPVGVPESDLPVVLPDIKEYEPSGTGESPLVNVESWVNTECPECGGEGKRETNTMPQWAGSSWYYLRYMDPNNTENLVDKNIEQNWSPVDFYVGGAEHATRHLIYARFWHKFLFDIGVVAHDEPFIRLQHVGLVAGEDGRKMSKRWGNVINPDTVVAEFGADSLRIYEMFMGPFDQAVSWNTRGLVGAKRFLDRTWNAIMSSNLGNESAPEKAFYILHTTIKKVSEDIENFRLNTAISSLMTCVNNLNEMDLGKDHHKIWTDFLVLLSPFTPHFTEELWEEIGKDGSVVATDWPKYDEKFLEEKTIHIAIQINGKLRGEIVIDKDTSEEDIFATAKAEAKIIKYLSEGNLVKEIYIKGKLVNFVVKN